MGSRPETLARFYAFPPFVPGFATWRCPPFERWPSCGIRISCNKSCYRSRASTTRGQLLTEEEKEVIGEACDMAVELNNCKSKIFEYLESTIASIAPNLMILVGASTAAKLIGAAESLKTLSMMSPGKLSFLGSDKTTLPWFSPVANLPRAGFIYYSKIVQETPPHLRRKAVKLVAAKSVLAAKTDFYCESKDGHDGQMLREGIEKKLDKLQELPPVKFVKPLPKPIDVGQKKRGGKRARKIKEPYAITELRKRRNRIYFADVERGDAYQDDLGWSWNTGRIRPVQINEKTKVRLSKTLQKNLQKQQQWEGSTTIKKQVSGIASSTVFTPLQGFEVISPQTAEKKVNDANTKYFSKTAGFLYVKM
ncbi:U4/U6 small nuclear ribonucleoprotein Prp31-like [Monomorium pharaonis]|uniref:U4/U6 small nuclear ribonucleoprotein Prp31-like n=1 Tax=Monomorium pharaonis TaxID=307658 RepID=UPI001747A0E2|nr:U4/U6 small nuclear ribonucleoprotein Prp31-like [Monomorium pharaonis]